MFTPFLYENTNIFYNLLSFADILVVILPMLLAVAFMTLLERKILAATQRRHGPDTTGVYGILQPFADALHYILGICLNGVNYQIPGNS